MNSIWLKNKWSLISLLIYLIVIILFGEVKDNIQISIYLLSIFIIPAVNNFRIDKQSIWTNMIGGFIFGILISPFKLTFFGKEYESNFDIPYQSQIFFWVLILSLNICFVLHRTAYKLRNEDTGISDKRDIKIESLLHPTKRIFLQ